MIDNLFFIFSMMRKRSKRITRWSRKY